MKTIEVNGNPHNVDDAIASEILGARQNLENKLTAKEAIEMAEAAMEIASQPVEVMGRAPLYLDSADIAEGLHKDGLLDVLYIGEEEVYVTPSFAQELHRDGLLVEVHADAKCSGRGWMPGGPNGKCKRVPKGTSKKVASETAGINRIAKGGTKNKARSARIKELRGKFGVPGENRESNAAVGRALAKSRQERKVKSLDRMAGKPGSGPSPESSGGRAAIAKDEARRSRMAELREKLRAKSAGKSNSARAANKKQAAGGRTSPKRKRS